MELPLNVTGFVENAPNALNELFTMGTGIVREIALTINRCSVEIQEMSSRPDYLRLYRN